MKKVAIGPSRVSFLGVVTLVWALCMMPGLAWVVWCSVGVGAEQSLAPQLQYLLFWFVASLVYGVVIASLVWFDGRLLSEG